MSHWMTQLRKVINKLLDDKWLRPFGILIQKAHETIPQYQQNLDRLEEIRDSVVESTLEALKQGNEEELNTQVIQDIQNFPRLRQTNKDISLNTIEAQLINTYEDVLLEHDIIQYDEPIRPLLTLLKLCSSPDIIYSYLLFKGVFGLRDRKDFDSGVGQIINRLHQVLRDLLGDRFREQLYTLMFKYMQLYGFGPVYRLKPEDVYKMGYNFYKNNENERTITFSVSSGLLNPLERLGADEFTRRYGIMGQKVEPKNPYRKENFSDGVLNKNINCKRIYIWERKGTSSSLQKALELVPQEKRQMFLDDAVNLLKEALMFDKIKLLQVDQMEDWMRRFTRNGKGEFMLSLRGSKSKRITHAVYVRYNLQRWERREFAIKKLKQIIPTLISTGNPMAFIVSIIIAGEDLVYEMAKKEVRNIISERKKHLDYFLGAIDREADVLKGWESLSEKEAQRKAENIIEGLFKKA